MRCQRSFFRLLALGAVACAIHLPAAAIAQQTGAPARRPDVHYVPTPPAVVEAMLRVAKVSSRDTVYDLGSGDGRIVIAAAKTHGARGTGIDIDPQRIAEARENAQREGVSDRVRFLQQDLFESNFKEATVVTLYLLNTLNLKLRPILLDSLRPGTRVVSHAFNMGEWEADSAFTVNGANVYYWVIPARVTGSWTWSAPAAGGGAARQHELRLTQEFQKVTGSLLRGRDSIPIVDGRLKGDSLSFTIRAAGADQQTGAASTQFIGRVQGNRIDGWMTSTRGPAAGRHRWQASRSREGTR